MNSQRFAEITARYAKLRIAIVGDFCLDRYLEIDPARQETSIETDLPVHNVVRVRSQPGGAGTILNNLAALGVGTIIPIGFCGDDGEGFELRRALAERPGVDLRHFTTTAARRTFTYCKPLVVAEGRKPVELSRLDSKNWSSTPPEVGRTIAAGLNAIGDEVDAVIVLDQVDLPETGAVTAAVRETAHQLQQRRPELLVMADSRQGLREFPPLAYKMNAAELERLAIVDGESQRASIEDVGHAAARLARKTGRPVFVTLSERGIVGAVPPRGAADFSAFEHAPSLPTRGAIDIVGAGDAVTANLASAWASGATLREALELSMGAASIVVHQLGTTGTAGVAQLRETFGC